MKNAVQIERRLGSIKVVAARLDISERMGWKLLASARLIRPLRIGRSVKFDLDELDAWLAARAPSIDEWEAMKAEQKGARP